MLNYENTLICKKVFLKKGIAETSDKMMGNPCTWAHDVRLRELPQSPCGDNREGVLFSWQHVLCSSCFCEIEHCRGSHMTTYIIYTFLWILFLINILAKSQAKRLLLKVRFQIVMQISVSVKEVKFIIFWFNTLLGYRFTLIEIIYYQKPESQEKFLANDI